MTIPNFQYFLSPVLIALEDNKVKNRQEIYKTLYAIMNFTDEDYQVRVKSGQQVIANRAGWA